MYFKNTCINCGIYGHTFKYCIHPIISYGIIPYRKDFFNNIEFLLIERKDSIGFTDFIRGKYEDISIIHLYLEEMTKEELIKLRTLSFKELWDCIFLNKNSKIYKNEYYKCKTKYEMLDIIELTDNILECRYKTQEHGFPKGRPDLKEEPLKCALREFTEETGYNICDIIIKDFIPFKEKYLGINNKEYICIYYIGEIISNNNPIVDKNNVLQSGEIKSIKWYDIKTAYKIFRDYHIIKKYFIKKLIDLIK